jgi:signal transduction histidine kinase
MPAKDAISPSCVRRMNDRTPSAASMSPAAVEGFRRRIGEVNLRGTRIAGTLGAILVPTFSLVDYIVLRPVFDLLLATRIVVSAICVLIVMATFRKGAWRISAQLSAAVIIVCGLAIAVMIHLHDAIDPSQSPTPYYAGLFLVVVGAAQLCTWSLKESILVFSAIYFSYVLPTVILQPPARAGIYVAHNFFLVATIIIAAVGQFFEHKLQLREFLASSEVEAANQRLETAYEKLKELDAYKNQFFSNITHELKTPLTLILAPTEAIIKGEMGEFSPDQQEYFRRIYQNGLRLMKLINDLLDLAKLEDSKLKLRVEETNLSQFVQGLLSNIKPLAERKKITLEDTVPEHPVVAWIDHDRMEQVLINLLANAVKFTPENGKIGVTVSEHDGEYQVVVADSGIGIPVDKLELVFDRFSQVDGTTTRKFGGTGIGLALAKELTQLHGGRIWAESTEGSGTRMIVRLRAGTEHFDPTVLDRRERAVDTEEARRAGDGSMPQWSQRFETRNDYKYLAVDEATERRLAPRDSAPSVTRSNARVLVCEDSKEMLQFIHLQLKDRYHVSLAENGARGWELVEKTRPDLVVTDYMMPEMDGLELTELIKTTAATKHIPVVMLTAKAGTSDRVAGKDAGADEYLGKPFSTSELLAVIKQLLQAKEHEADRLVTHRMDSVEIIAGRLAHEIHNPLNYMKNGAMLIGKAVARLNKAIDDDGDDADKQRARAEKSINRLLEQINVGADRIGTTVDLLKEYAREGYSPELRTYSVLDGVQAVLSVVRDRDGLERAVELVHDESVGDITCVPQEFHEIVSNLIQNAFDATPADGTVTVRLSGDAAKATIEVQDTGEGMSQEVVDKVFSPFFTTKEPGRGMGMGTTIVYRLVKRYGGSIDIDSEEGVGTRFTVVLPRQPSD